MSGTTAASRVLDFIQGLIVHCLYTDFLVLLLCAQGFPQVLWFLLSSKNMPICGLAALNCPWVWMNICIKSRDCFAASPGCIPTSCSVLMGLPLHSHVIRGEHFRTCSTCHITLKLTVCLFTIKKKDIRISLAWSINQYPYLQTIVDVLSCLELGH